MEKKEKKEQCSIRIINCNNVDGQIFKESLGVNRIVRMIEYYPSLTCEENLIYNDVFFLEKIMRIIDLSNNSSDFVPILGVNFCNYKKDHLFLSKILAGKPQIQVSKFVQDIIERNSLGKQNKSLLESVKSQITNILRKNKSILDYFHQQSYEFYIFQSQNSFKIQIGFTNFFFTHSKKKINSKIVQIIDNLLQHYQKMDEFSNIQSNQITKVDCSQQIATDKVQQQLYDFFSVYNEQICDFIDIALHNGLTQIIYKKSIINSPFIRQKCISLIDPSTKQIYSEQIYHNPLCWHLQGITKSIYFSTKQCPICGNILKYAQAQLQMRCRNIFQMMLLCNHINNRRQNINYFFYDRVFTLKSKDQIYYRQQFNDFFHFKIYTQRINPLIKRQKIILLNQYETIPLFNRISAKKKYYEISSMIDCPVRGQYCRHWQFYDLRKVYKSMLQSNDEYFQCFVCCKEIKFNEILYLHEAKELISLIKQIIAQRNYQGLINSSIKVNHEEKRIKVNVSGENNFMEEFILDIYCTFENPLMKSRGDSDFFEERQIQPPQSFISTFYGF